MAWKTMDVREQRVRFVVAASLKQRPFSALCAEFGISRPTGYLWLDRQGGVAAIAECSRRPLHSPARTSPMLEEPLIALRRRYPDWGARKLAVLLAREGIELPVSTIHRILLRHGLVRDCDRHGAALKRFERERPNELWQMDFKGPKNWPRALTPLSVIDDHDCRGIPETDFQGWLDRFRAEHNTLRPHEALKMKTPAELWQPSPRRYNPCPPVWEYPQGSWTLKVDCQGTIDIGPQRWRIGKTLAGERVMIQPIENRYMVFYCTTLVREIDPAMKRSTIVERFIATKHPDNV